jgi:hypothetical protein
VHGVHVPRRLAREFDVLVDSARRLRGEFPRIPDLQRPFAANPPGRGRIRFQAISLVEAAREGKSEIGNPRFEKDDEEFFSDIGCRIFDSRSLISDFRSRSTLLDSL